MHYKTDIMENKLQELTEKIYKEGVEKGSEEANRIISDAKKEAGQIVKKAEAEAETILSKANNEAENLKKSVEAELKLTYDQSVSVLKQDVTELISDALVDSTTEKSFKDVDFFNQFLLTLAKTWAEKQELQLDIPEKDEKGIESYLKKNITDLLKKGITLNKVAGIQSGFQIGPADGSYKVSFTDADFENFIHELLRPRVAKILFKK
jgi:V/A-type H+-transporting ATPase subunit E